MSVGIDHDTAGLRRGHHPPLVADDGPPALSRRPRDLLITADGGGSNGARLRLWKWELQKLGRRDRADASRVCHLPPGTSKWNKIEHRLFSFISQNWRGRPLLTHAVIVNLIAATRTRAGLTVRCVLDTHRVPQGGPGHR